MKHILISFLMLLGLAHSVQSQSLVSMTPSTGAVGTTVNVTITGNKTSFSNTTTFVLSLGSSVITLSNVNALSATSATAKVVIPANAASGSYSLLAVVGLGLPLQLPNAFTVTGGAPAAALVSISPNSANQGQSLLVTITGVNTHFSQSTNTTITLTSLGGGGTPIVTPSAIPQNNTTLKTLVSIPANAAPGQYALIVTTSNDGTLILSDAFTVTGTSTNTPKLTSVAPSSANRGQTLNVTITGANTSFMQGSNLTVSLFAAGSPVQANFAFANSNTSITANFTIPVTETLGLHDVYVTSTADGFLTLPSAFTVTESGSNIPQLVSVDPPYGHKGQTLDITITGVNTHFTQGSNILAMYVPDQSDGFNASSFTVQSDTKIVGTFTIPDTWSNGLYTIGVVSDVDGILELPSSFSLVSVGLKELVNGHSILNMYPNPVTTQLTFETKRTVKTVSFMDVTGKTVPVTLEDLIRVDSETYKVDITQLGLKKGIYFIRVETDQDTLYQKFIAE